MSDLALALLTALLGALKSRRDLVLENHLGDLVSIDFFTVPTARFRVLFCLLVLSHKRR